MPHGADATEKLTIALVVGGSSSEHGVSCLTGASVAGAIDSTRYQIIGVGVTPSGRFVQLSADDIAALRVEDGRLPSLGDNRPDAVWFRDGEHVVVATRDGDQLVDRHRVDLAFTLLHGPFGEDGTVQGMFEMLGLRYVGAGVMTSAVGMDKQVMKQVMASAGLPIGPFATITPQQWEQDRTACLDAVASLCLPVYVKPARGGSSIGITRVTDLADLPDAVAAAQKWDPKVIVEEGFVDAREIECGVLGSLDGRPEASQVAEIVMQTEDAFYDFESKYLPDEQVRLDVPADLDSDIAEQVRDLAVRTFEVFGCEGLARVDTFFTHEGRVVVNEINTMPGFTEHSMYPRMWAASGVAYPELISRLIELALARPLGLR